MEKKHRNSFIIKKYGHDFRIVVRKPRVIAYLLIGYGGCQRVKGVANCKEDLDTFNAKYGVRLAVKRAFLTYHHQKLEILNKEVERLENFISIVSDGLDKEIRNFAPKVSYKD